jgi:hypothetical protein
LLLKILPGGGISLRTRASPGGIFLEEAVNEASSRSSSRRPRQSRRG